MKKLFGSLVLCIILFALFNVPTASALDWAAACNEQSTLQPEFYCGTYLSYALASGIYSVIVPGTFFGWVDDPFDSATLYPDGTTLRVGFLLHFYVDSSQTMIQTDSLVITFYNWYAY